MATLNASYALRKKITAFSAMIFLLLLVGYFLVSNVGAASSNIEANFVNAADSVKEFVNTSNLVEDVVNKFEITSAISGRKESATGDEDLNTRDLNEDSFAGHLTQSIEVIADGLCLIYISIYIIREAMRGDTSMDFWFKIFAVMGITWVLVGNWDVFMGKIESAGWYAVEQAGEINSDDVSEDELLDNMALAPAQILRENNIISEIPDGIEKATKSYWETGDPSEAIELLNPVMKRGDYNTFVFTALQVAIFNLMRIGFLCAIDAQVFFIAVQLVMRRALAPIAIVDVAMGGARGGGVRYMKRFFALYVQMVICIVVSAAFMGILQNVFKSQTVTDSNSIVRLYYMMSCMGAVIVAVSQSGSLAQELIGD